MPKYTEPMSRVFLLIIILFISLKGISQQQEKKLQAIRITTPPKIDGVLDDPVWKSIPPSGDFVMFEPGNEGIIPDNLKTEVKMAYDDKAIYIAAYLYHSDPESIASQFSQRDEIFVQADHFMVGLNTYIGVKTNHKMICLHKYLITLAELTSYGLWITMV